MFTEINEIDKKVSLFAEEDDMCDICANFDICPLLAALSEEAVVLRYESVNVVNCPLFEELRPEMLELFPG